MTGENGEVGVVVASTMPESNAVGITLPNRSLPRGGNLTRPPFASWNKKRGREMKKMASFVGLAVFLALFSVDASAAECHGGFVKNASGSDLGDEFSSTHQAACTDKDRFHIPAAVPLFLSAIAGLGIVAFRGKER